MRHVTESAQLNLKPPFGAKMCSDVCPWILPVPQLKTTLSENSSLLVTNNIGGKISKHKAFH